MGILQLDLQLSVAPEISGNQKYQKIKMSEKMSSKAARKVSWSQKLADFTIMLPSGQTLECHKLVLATHSPVFEELFTKDKQISTITVDQFEQATVVSFLEYMYAETFNEGHQPMMKDNFDAKLLRMADHYGFKKLQEECAEYMREKVSDENAMSLWMEAEKSGNERLYATVIKYLVERSSGRGLEEVHGFADAFGHYKKPLRELLTSMSAKNAELRENAKEKDEVSLQLAACSLQRKEKDTEQEVEISQLKETNAKLVEELESKNCQLNEMSNDQDNLSDVNAKLKEEIAALKEELKSQTLRHKEHIRRQYCTLSKYRVPGEKERSLF